MRQQAQLDSSTSENHPSSLSDNPLSLRTSPGIETYFTVHSYPRSTHVNGDQVSVTSGKAINTADLAYHKLEENSRPPIPDLYPYPRLIK